MAALALALGLLVVVLYEHADVPSAAARAASGGAAGGGAGQTGGRAGAVGERPAGRGDAGPAKGQGSAGRARGDAAPDRAGGGGDRSGGGVAGGRGSATAGTVGERPAEVAAAWYAARHHLPRKLVRPLQQDRISARELRVLVLADPGGGRVRTALVRVRLGRSGWAVP
jgi:hypothetical protein